MDFFTATSDPAAQLYDGHITTPGHGRPRNSPAAQAEPVDAFAEAINARYSRTNTLLIPLSPNQTPSTSAATPAVPSSFIVTMPPPPPRPLPTLTLPSRPAPPVLSAPPPKPPPPQTLPTRPPEAAQPAPAATAAPAPAASAATPATTTAEAQTPLPASAFTPITPSTLAPLLAPTSSTLLLDIRAHNAYTLARLPGALSLSVPSTLLKRPNFSLARLAQMLPSPLARARFSAFASCARVLVYDADSASLADAGNLLGFMRKLRKEGYTGEVCWLRGGFHAVWRERGELVDREPPPAEEEDEAALASVPAMTMAPPVLRAKNLPMDAFTSTSTASRALRLPPGRGSSAIPPTPFGMPPRLGAAGMPSVLGLGGQRALTLPMSIPMTDRALPTAARHHSVPGTQTANVPFNPFFDNIRQNMELYPSAAGAGPARTLGGRAAASDEWIVLRLPWRTRRRVGELPFEWLRAIARGCGGAGAGSSGETSAESASVSEVEDDDDDDGDVFAVGGKAKAGKAGRAIERKEKRGAIEESPKKHDEDKDKEGEELAKALALQFYKIELGEQRRLMGVMEHHSMESAVHHPASGSSTVPASAPAHSTTFAPATAPASGPTFVSTSSATSSSSASSTSSPAIPASTSYSTQSTARASEPQSQTAAHADTTSESEPASESTSRTAPKSKSKAKSASKSKEREREKAEVFPYSITAGVEKGDKNRYRNIWPFEHARVRLLRKSAHEHGRFDASVSGAESAASAGHADARSETGAGAEEAENCQGRKRESGGAGGRDDYMNASYVQPLGTTKRYIATQGPLEATFADFWTLVWEQNVHVIVMLTREVESALVKCGNYWAEGAYGPLRLTLLSTSDTPDRERARRERETSGGLFARHPVNQGAKQAAEADEEQTIRRVFSLRHTGFTRAPPRRVTQLQYLEWPDLDVPQDPRGLLQLMQEVDEAAEAARVRCGGQMWGEGPLGGRGVVTEPVAAPPQREHHVAAGEEEDGDDEESEVESDSSDAVDSETGVARRAMARPPVLLHCSAGVGRTGGFIAVDAVLDGVRREMRKRREARAAGHVRPNVVRAGSATTGSEADAMEVDSGVSSPPRSLSAAVSPAESGPRDREMDVDRSGTSSPGAMNTDADAEISAMSSVDNVSMGGMDVGMTAPVSVGGRNVHVPVVGFQRERSSSAMDVDVFETDRSRSTSAQPVPVFGAATSAVKQASTNVVKNKIAIPSPDLVDEVRRANASVGTSPAIPVAVPLHAPFALLARPSKTERSTSTSTGASAFSGFEPSRPGSSASPASSSRAGSSSSVVPQLGKLAVKDKRKVQDEGLGRWLEGVDAAPVAKPVQVPTVPAPALDQEREREHVRDPTHGEHRNYATAAPRKLHGNTSPPLLSTYAEPIRRVVEDMREQRMSLCQSLRQYVFVHRAIVEGALMIVDAEREKERAAEAEQAAAQLQKTPMRNLKPKDHVAAAPPKTTTVSAPIAVNAHPDVSLTLSATLTEAQGLVASSPLGAAFMLKEKDPRKDVAMSIALPDGGLSAVALSSPSPRSKRQASPTEPSGSARLSKRPSVKRKQRSSDEESTDPGTEEVTLLSSPLAKDGLKDKRALGTRYEAMALETPSPASSPSPTQAHNLHHHHHHHHHHHRQLQTTSGARVEGSTSTTAGAAHKGAAAAGVPGSR